MSTFRIISRITITNLAQRSPWAAAIGGALLSALLLLTAVGCPPPSYEPTDYPDPAAETQDVPELPKETILSELDMVEKKLFWQSNEIRRQNGLLPFTLKADLCRAARKQSRDMLQVGRVTRQSAEGKEIGDRLHDLHIGWNHCGENVAVIGPSGNVPQRALQYWLGHPVERNDLLNHMYNETGVAVVQDPKTGKYFVTQIYLRRSGYWYSVQDHDATTPRREGDSD
jgi:uncharacterized protein YkwD